MAKYTPETRGTKDLIPAERVTISVLRRLSSSLGQPPPVSTICARESRRRPTWLFHAKAAKPWAIGPADLDEYVRVLAAPGAMRAALSYYRAAFSPEGLAQSRGRTERKLTMPVLVFGAEYGVGQGLIDTLRPIANDVRGGVMAGCGHYMPEEYPEAVSNELLRFFKTTDR